MEKRVASSPFHDPATSVGTLDSDVASRVILAASDVALILDREGVISDFACGSGELPSDCRQNWLGRPWVDTVTVESRPKVEAMLHEAGRRGEPRWRQVNHPYDDGPDIPIRYSAIGLGTPDRILALGRDLRPIAALQQRLVDAQNSLERDYLRLRQAEARYRALFQLAAEPVLIVDAATLKVSEANPTADELFPGAHRQPVGHGLPDLFHADSRAQLHAMLSTVRAAGRADPVPARLRDGERAMLVSASLFPQERAPLLLVRLTEPGGAVDHRAGGPGSARSRLLAVLENLPEAFVVTAPDLRILAANATFLELTMLASEEQGRSESLDRFVGRHGVDLDVLIANLREHGAVRQFLTVLRDVYGSMEDVEISAVSGLDGEPPCFGFAIRKVGVRLTTETRVDRDLRRSVEQLTGLVGQVSLQEIVRETTDLIERLCIEAALELTQGNRMSAAELLGLSRQSLYTKLRRHGFGNVTQ